MFGAYAKLNLVKLFHILYDLGLGISVTYADYLLSVFPCFSWLSDNDKLLAVKIIATKDIVLCKWHINNNLEEAKRRLELDNSISEGTSYHRSIQRVDFYSTILGYVIDLK